MDLPGRGLPQADERVGVGRRLQHRGGPGGAGELGVDGLVAAPSGGLVEQRLAGDEVDAGEEVGVAEEPAGSAAGGRDDERGLVDHVDLGLQRGARQPAGGADGVVAQTRRGDLDQLAAAARHEGAQGLQRLALVDQPVLRHEVERAVGGHGRAGQDAGGRGVLQAQAVVALQDREQVARGVPPGATGRAGPAVVVVPGCSPHALPPVPWCCCRADGRPVGPGQCGGRV
ncbi:hypothetical protein [Quadrisphaera sp. INWT6]|uniref:hypothetical protein n=1 Tax=Quadrisphaera sp. INWT6 TaxID=2596917 RepID=UPI0018925A2B|nr:hypothetical protein [Quadrisphaera sp. INWT6]MBF5082614.1 hypothetical protein [Quadrisphaera sp. INWT6]